MTDRQVSPVTEASNRFVEAHAAQAKELGRALASEIHDPSAFVRLLTEGMTALADPAYRDGIRAVTPGLVEVLGVRQSLLSAAHRPFARLMRRVSSSVQLDVYERLAREELAELRWFAMWSLEPLLATDPERTWQLLRRFAQAAHEWVTVDTLGHPYGAGILLDARRWAELEQLIYSPSRWERRLVGSTLAELPFLRRVPGARDAAVAEHGLGLIGDLIGDDEPDVQKALSWALRSLTLVDRGAVEAFLEAQSRVAVETRDGHRAWVIRDALSKLDPETAALLRDRIAGIRKAPRQPSTSRAARTAAEFLPGLPASPVPVS